MNQYMEYSNNRNPNYQRVEMNNGEIITFNNNEEEQVIYTYGLCGCIACSVIIEIKNGQKIAIMTHYDPIHLKNSTNKNDIVRLLKNIDKENIKTIKSYILAPSEWKNTNEKWEQKIKTLYEKGIKEIENTIKPLTKNIEMNIIGYSELIDTSQKNQGTFRILNKKGTITFIVENYSPMGSVF